MTRRAIKLLDSKRNDAYEAALAALREDTGCADFSKVRCCLGSITGRRNWRIGEARPIWQPEPAPSRRGDTTEASRGVPLLRPPVLRLPGFFPRAAISTPV